MSFRVACMAVVTAMILAGAPAMGWTGVSDEEEIIQSEILESFESTEGWEVEYSEHGIQIPANERLKLMDGRPGKMLITHGEENHFIGVKGDFRRMGYNFIEVRRTKGKEIEIPGKVRTLDVWVWGGNYDYRLEIQLDDYMGMTHTLPLGSLEFTGWRNLSVRVPEGVRYRTAKYFPKKPRADWLRFTKFVIWTPPHERTDGFYCYFDRMKAITDVFELPFDGRDLSQLRW